MGKQQNDILFENYIDKHVISVIKKNAKDSMQQNGEDHKSILFK